MSTSYLWYLGWLVATAMAATALTVVEKLTGMEPNLGETVVYFAVIFSPVLGLGAVIGLCLVRFVERSYDLRPVVAGSVAYAVTATGVTGVITWFLKFQ
ncbi:hypothetical protein ACFCV3_34030 [Kribbella sp. NPDC056345]|uniref:hypothetical protein n=1 Tax=Kribbella sp. NPDC056345 TaxID=3345789 RepID=UPI0035E1AAA8